MDTLLITPELFASEGGIARVLRLYLKALCELSGASDKVRLVSLNDSVLGSSDLRAYSSSRLVEWQACSGSKLEFGKATLRIGLRTDRIVCGHVAQLPLAWAVSLVRPKLAYYLVAHGIEVWRPFTFLERVALSNARCVWCVSDYTRQQLLTRCKVPLQRTAVLPNALDPYFEPKSPAAPSDCKPVILTVSRLSLADSYKGIDHLIKAMPAVLAEIPDATLRIVGRGDALPALQALAASLGIEKSVVFAGYRSDAELKTEFLRCRLFALPSQKEGFGLVYLEAMAHGRPCLGARSGGAPEVITSDTGVLVQYGDVNGLAAAAVAALRRDWPQEPILQRARMFSYERFKEGLAGLLSR